MTKQLCSFPVRVIAVALAGDLPRTQVTWEGFERDQLEAEIPADGTQVKVGDTLQITITHLP